jgi:glycosyltransferase involved in cell wall biosynthesis
MAAKLNIAFLTRGIDENPFNGPPVFLYNFIKYLCTERKDEFNVFLFHNDRNRDLDIYALGNEIVLSGNNLKIAFQIHQICKEKKIDIFHLNRMPTDNALIFFNRAKLVVMLHGDLFISLPQYTKDTSFFKQKYKVLLFSKLGFLKRVSIFLTVSDSLKEIYKEFLDLPESRFTTTYVSINRKNLLKNKELEPPEAFKAIGLKEKSFFLFVGNYHPIKNGVTLLKVIGVLKATSNILNRKPFLIIGKNWTNNPEIQVIIKTYNIEIGKDLYFIDGLQHAEMAAIYSRAYAFVNASLHESFGLTNLEAMICECPLITTTEYGAKELVGDAGFIIKDPLDKKQIASKIIEFEKEDLGKDLIKKGIIQANKFDQEIVYNRIIKAYSA